MKEINRKDHAPGDLVVWSEGGSYCTGIVLESWDSNMYEPAECSVLTLGGKTIFMRARNLKTLNKASDVLS